MKLYRAHTSNSLVSQLEFIFLRRGFQELKVAAPKPLWLYSISMIIFEALNLALNHVGRSRYSLFYNRHLQCRLLPFGGVTGISLLPLHQDIKP